MSTEGTNKGQHRKKCCCLEKLTPEARLFRTYAFWISVLVPVFVSAGLICMAVYETPLNWCPTAKGIKFFYDHFKLPIAIASLSIPLGALVATHHRSMQTAKQIEIQQQEIENQRIKDSIALHFEHKKQFVDFVKEAKPFAENRTKNAWELYETLYPSSRSKDLTVNKSIMELVQRVVTDLSNIAGQLIEEKKGDREPRDSIQRSMPLRKLRKEINELLGSTNSPKNDPSLTVLADLTMVIVELTKGIIECSNFQRQSFDRSIISGMDSLCYDIQVKEDRLENRSKAAEEMSDVILDLDGMNAQSLSPNTKRRLIESIARNLNELENDDDKEDLDLIINFHLSSYNFKALVQNCHDEILQYFNELY